jgi:hypothetical protein
MPNINQRVAVAIPSQRRYTYGNSFHTASFLNKTKDVRRESDRKRNRLRSRQNAVPQPLRPKASRFALAGPLPAVQSEGVSVALLGLEAIAKQRTYEAASGLANAVARILAASSSEDLGAVLRVVAREANEAYFADLVEAFGEVPIHSAKASLITFLYDSTESPSPYLRQAARNALDLIESDT